MDSAIVATTTRQALTIHASSSTSATYSFIGASIVGWDVTWKTGINCSGAAFSNCGEIDAKGAQFNNCTITNTRSTDAAIAFNADSSMSGTTLDVTGTSAAYHLELGTAVTAFTLTNCTFTGTPATDKIHVKATTGTVTITLATGQDQPTYVSDGATVVFDSPAVEFIIQRPNILNGGNYIIENTTQATELASGTTSGGTGIDVTLVEGTDYDAGDNIRLRIGYTSGVTAKLPISESFTGPATSSTNNSPTAMEDYTVYNTIGIDGSTKTGIFAADYIDDEIDITLASDFLGQDFMAWWVYNEATLDGLRNFFGVYTLEDEANMRNNNGTLSVMFDNTTATNIKQIDNVRIYRTDLAYPVRDPSSGGGCIDIVWREKVLVTTIQISGANVSEIADAVWAKTI